METVYSLNELRDEEIVYSVWKHIGKLIIIKGINMKKFDKEYSTQYVAEMKYLQSKGINYSFVKDIHGVTTYKYTKTPELFKALVFFYMENK